MKYKLFILFLLLTTITFANLITLKSSQNKYFITDVELLEDEKQEFLHEYVVSLDSKYFKKTKTKIFDFSFSNSAYWIRFSLKNTINNGEIIILETPYFRDLSLQFSLFSEDGQLEKRFLSNYIKHKKSNLVLNIPKDSTKIIIIKCIPNNSPMKFPLIILTQKSFAQKIISEYSAVSFYFGIMLLLSLNSILLGILFKDSSYLAFGLYIFTFILLYFYSLEIPRLFGIRTEIIVKAINLTYYLNIFSLLAFTQIYFSISQKNLKLVYSFFKLFCFSMMSFVLLSNNIWNLFSRYIFHMYTSFSITLLILFTIFYNIQYKKRDSLYFTLGMFPFSIASLIKILEIYSILPTNFFTTNSNLIGVFSSIILFYFLIGQRIKMLYRQKKNAQDNLIKHHKENSSLLEKLVSERTQELEEKNAQLEIQAKFIENKKEILHSLLLVSSAMQRSENIDDDIKFILEDAGKLFGEISFGIIMNGERESIVESIYFYKTNKTDQSFLINSQEFILKNSSYLKFENENFNIIRRYVSEINNEIWSIFPLTGKKGHLLGKLFVKTKTIKEHHLEIIFIFLDHLTIVTENKLLTSSLEKMANTDFLTQIYNRNFFDKELDNCIHLAKIFNIPFSVLVLDLNGLKKINDLYGHEEGDKLLVMASKIIKKASRHSDIAARLGGDEFAILCPSTTLEGANILIKRIRDLEGESNMCFISTDPDSETFCIHMSIGIGSSMSTDPDKVMSEADRNMYKDKELYYKTHEKYRNS